MIQDSAAPSQQAASATTGAGGTPAVLHAGPSQADAPVAPVVDPALRRVSPNSLGKKIARLLWSIVENTFYRLSFHTWSRWRIALLRVFGADVAWDCTIRRTSRIYYPWLFKMGSLSSLGDKTEIYNLGRITLGKRVTISQEAYVCAGTHDYTKISMPLITSPITVGDDVWICARAFIGPGVTVGDGAIVAACAVAVKEIAPWTIVGGNPARFVKIRPPVQVPA